jgi:colanic acid/amylovoran biosynthesis glycosyltransferase
LSRLIFFTNTYPYGTGEQWKTNELEIFQHYFDEIKIIPFHNGKNPTALPLQGNASSEAPLFHSPTSKLNLNTRLSLLNGPLKYFLKEFFGKRVYRSKRRFNNWNSSAVRLTKMLRHPTIAELFQQDQHDTVFYFYWGVWGCDLIPFLSAKFPEAKYYVRYHGYDLYESRNGGYIPFREKVLEKLNAAIAISSYGKEYLYETYLQSVSFSVVLNRLGVPFVGNATPSTDGTLRIVSCASLIPIKRVQLIYESLLMVNFPVEWIHIGDGELMGQLKQLVHEQAKTNIKVVLLGKLPPNKVVEQYLNNPVDLFVHVSETEGVPVVVMEALSASIPVIATNAGGTNELIDESCGQLIPVDFKPLMLANELKTYYEFSELEKRSLAKGAFERYKNYCNPERNARELAIELSKPG